MSSSSPNCSVPDPVMEPVFTTTVPAAFSTAPPETEISPMLYTEYPVFCRYRVPLATLIVP